MPDRLDSATKASTEAGAEPISQGHAVPDKAAKKDWDRLPSQSEA
jgi:hypothetical protein